MPALCYPIPMAQSIEKQLNAITEKTEEVLPLADLKSKLKKYVKSKKPLNVKFGVDPTSPDLHLGHAVALKKLRQMQDAGHTVTLIIGDFTALIGDPSGKKATRPQLSVDEVADNAKTYTDQAFKILNKKKTQIKFNSHWLRVLNFTDVIKLSAKFTVARLLERDDFSDRYKKEQPISLHEFLYPVMQAYDSVMINSDIELGGTDQKFNMLAGRDLQEKEGQEAQVVITIPILEGIDGVQKMSKSLGNHIGLTEPPNEMFGKVMSIPDDLLIPYFKLTTNYSEKQVKEIEQGLKKGKLHPGETKRKLAREIITIYYNAKKAQAAEDEFDRIHIDKQLPSKIEIVEIYEDKTTSKKYWIVKLLVKMGLASSNGEARRFIEGGAVKLNKALIDDVNAEVTIRNESILQVGKRKCKKIKLKSKIKYKRNL